MPQPVGTTDPELASRLECINQLTALLPSLHLYADASGSSRSHTSGTQPQTKGTQALSKGKEALSKGRQLALTEDWQLQGFLPLQQCHGKLNFERRDEAQVSACQ